MQCGGMTMNVITVLVDTVRRDFLKCYGNEHVRTPNISRLASMGTVYDNTYLGSFPCMPARRDFFTGKFEFPWRGWGPLEDDDVSLPQILKANHKPSMLISDHYHLWERGAGNYHYDFSGFEFIRGQENDMWITDPTIPISYPSSMEKICAHMYDVESGNDADGAFERYCRNINNRKTEEDYFAARVMRTAINWVERNRTLKDFFLLIDCFDPHEPFDPPYPYDQLYDSMYKGDKIIWPSYGWADRYTEKELRNIRSLYAGELSFVDKWLGRLLDKIEELNLLQDTAIIFVTDHGHMLGEHNVIGKPWLGLADSNLYQELAHIPLVIWDPHHPGNGQRVTDFVQLVDLFPTILDFFNINNNYNTHGRSVRIKENQTAPRPDVILWGKFGESINITDGQYTAFFAPTTSKAVWYSHSSPHRVRVTGRSDGFFEIEMPSIGELSPALYNIEEDPYQQHNIINERPDVIPILRNELQRFLNRIEAPNYLYNRYGL